MLDMKLACYENYISDALRKNSLILFDFVTKVSF